MRTMTAFEVVNVTPDSPEWELERSLSCGASDVPAILGLSPYSTPLSVYRSKMGVPSDFDPELSYIGHAEEAVIEGWLRRFRPEVGEILPAQMVRSVAYPWLHASLDRRAMSGGVIVPIQMKTAHYFAGKEWGEEAIADSGVPLAVQVQVQTELLVFGAPFGWAVAFIGGRQFKLYRIERDEEFITDHLIPRTLDFWQNHVEAKVAPEASNVAELADLYPSVPEKVITGSEMVLEAADRRVVLLADIKEQQAEADALTLTIGTYMADAEVLEDSAGNPVLSFKSQNGRRGVTDIDELEAVHPEFVKRGNPFKVMRHIKPKAIAS